MIIETINLRNCPVCPLDVVFYDVYFCPVSSGIPSHIQDQDIWTVSQVHEFEYESVKSNSWTIFYKSSIEGNPADKVQLINYPNSQLDISIVSSL